MKKTLTLSIFCLLFAATFVSCKKVEKEWSKFYGYTVDDIVGQYTFSGASDAFANLVESDEGHLCFDAEVSINSNSASAQTVSLRVACPDHNLVKNFSGKPSPNDSPFLIDMYGRMNNFKQYGFTTEVLTNAQNDIRLKGFVTEDHYQREYNTETMSYDTVFDYSIKYYVDVIKN